MSTSPSSSATVRRDSDTVYDKPQGSYTPRSTLAVEVLQGKDRVVCFPGTSQFRLQGVSACGLAAFNFARISFRIAESCRSLLEALDKIASRETVEVGFGLARHSCEPRLILRLGGHRDLRRMVKRFTSRGRRDLSDTSL